MTCPLTSDSAQFYSDSWSVTQLVFLQLPSQFRPGVFSVNNGQLERVRPGQVSHASHITAVFATHHYYSTVITGLSLQGATGAYPKIA